MRCKARSRFVSAACGFLRATCALGMLSTCASTGSAQPQGRDPSLESGDTFAARVVETNETVPLACEWFARHQNADDSWGLIAYHDQCKDATCSHKASLDSDSAATAMALLPMLGEASKSAPVKFKASMKRGIDWLIGQQNEDGDLSHGNSAGMYCHALATMALCRAYGLTKEKEQGRAAQLAIDFIVKAQNATDGGWRYKPGEPGDTSSSGWQVLALQEADLAGLKVPAETRTAAKKWFASASSGKGGLFAYMPGGGSTPAMTAVGLASLSYLGDTPKQPALEEGLALLTGNAPKAEARNVYYWYHGARAISALASTKEREHWNRDLDAVLLASQRKEGCARGSWDPMLPVRDAWGDIGGRLLVTSLSCLTLQASRPKVQPNAEPAPAK